MGYGSESRMGLVWFRFELGSGGGIGVGVGV